MKVYIFLANGVEDIEVFTIIDILRRAEIEIMSVSLEKNLFLTTAFNNEIKANILFEEIQIAKDDIFILPGGLQGVKNIKQHTALLNYIVQYARKGHLIAAICAAPTVLGMLNILTNKKATCYKGFEKELRGAVYTDQNVVHDGNIITSKNPSTAAEFALYLVSQIKNNQTMITVKEKMGYSI